MAHGIVLQTQPDAPAGLLADWAARRGIGLETVRVNEHGAYPDPRDPDFVVALGSGATAAGGGPDWVDEEIEWLREADAVALPVLGICFGAQALAAALGGTVTRAPRTEIGWIDVDGTDGYGGSWFTWHEDAFTVPPGAVELARAPSGPQAFALGRSVGVQYHPEVTPKIVDDWLADGNAVPDPEPLRRETARRAQDARERAFRLFDRISAVWGT